MNQQTCPERQRIADYLLGLLDDDESHKIRSHMAECPDCEAAATKLESADDAFIRLLRRPEPERSFLDEPQWQEAVSRAAAIQTRGITEPDQPTGGALGTAGVPAAPCPTYLGEYKIVRLIGRGGMGAVYEARHTKLKRTVAIKLLPDRVANEDQAIRRFEREMEAVGGLKHPNIVQAHDAREIDGTRFLVMEYVEGQDLGELVKAGGRLPGETACRLIREAAEALAYAHDNGLVHRDVKPSNLMLAADGSIKVLDLGLAKIQEQEARDITNSGQLMGTVDYMAPEQGTDSHQVDHRADVYSLGCTLFHLLAGQPPYGKRSVREVFFAHVSAPVPSLVDVRPEAPPALDALIQKMMAKQPADRPQTMEEVATALREFESSECWRIETEEQETSELAPATPIVAAGTAAEPDSDRSVAPVKPRALGGKRRPPTIAIAAGGAAAFLLLLGILITIRTPNGTIEIEVDQPGAQVAVDGEVVMLTSPGEPEPIEVKAAKGGHTLVVSKGGFKTHTESFTIKSGDRQVFEVRLVPSEEEVDRRTEVGSGNVRVGEPDGERPQSLGSEAPPDEAKDNRAMSPEDGQQDVGPPAFGQLIESLDLGGLPIGSVAFSPGGETLIASGDNGVTLWSIPDLEQIAAHTIHVRHRLAFVLGGSAIATSPGPGFLDLETGDQKVLDFQEWLSYGLAASSDGSRVVCAYRGGQVRIVDAQSHAVRQQFSTGIHEPYNACFNRDGTRLAICGRDTPDPGKACSLVVWRLDTDKTQEMWRATGETINAAVFSNDGTVLIANGVLDGKHDAIYTWDVATGELLGQTFPHSGVQQVALSHDGSLLASASAYRDVRVFDLKTGEQLARLTDHSESVKGVAFSPDGTLLASCSHDGTVKLWNVARKAAKSSATATGEPNSAAWEALLPADAPPPAVAPFDAATAKKHQQAWADYLGMPVERNLEFASGVGLTMMLIPPGEFMMGSTEEEQARFLDDNQVRWEGPQHRVRISKPFALSRHEVTRGQFRQFVLETGYKTEAERNGKGGFGVIDGKKRQDPRFVWNGDYDCEQTDGHPVTCVSWNDAMAFCQWLSTKDGVEYRLPTEAQWEYACRAGTTTFWHCGDSAATLPHYAWFVANAKEVPHPVGQLEPNAWALHDMHGNVEELCWDFLKPGGYGTSPLDDPEGPPKGDHHIHRGGHRGGPHECRSASRLSYSPSDYCEHVLGFRVAADVPGFAANPPAVQPEPSKLAPAPTTATAAPAAESFEKTDAAETENAERDFVSLFDGTTLAGWQGATDNFTIDNGVVVNREDRGAIYTEKEYADFVLQFDFNLKKGANSGIVLFALSEASENPAEAEGVEIQILDDSSDHAYVSNDCRHGSVHGAVEAKQGALKPVGEWNTQEITCQEGQLSVTLNGTTILDVSLHELEVVNDGVLAKYVSRGKGRIGIFPWEGQVEFRNMRIREVPRRAETVELPESDIDREMALRAISRQTRVDIEVGGGVKRGVASESDLPDEPFRIVELDIGSHTDGKHIAGWVDDELLKRVGRLRQLTMLGLDEAAITDNGLEHLEDLAELRILVLAHTAVTGEGLAHLRPLKNVYSLNLRGTKVTNADLAELKSLTSLRNLDLARTLIDDQGLKILAEMPNLRQLYLGRRPVTDAGVRLLARLSDLTHLYLDDTAVTDESVESLSQLKNLVELGVTGTKMTSAGVAKLQKALPGCRILYDSPDSSEVSNHTESKEVDNDPERRAADWVLGVDGIIKIRIGEEELHLRQGEALPTGPFRLIGVFFTEGGRNEHPTWINDDSLRNLDGLTDLEMLRLSDTEVTDAGLTHLGQFKKLEWLELWGTEVTDAGLEHLQVLQNLTLLTLNDTQVTDAGLQHLAVLTQLKALYLSYNEGISDAGIKHLVGLKRVEHLSLGKANITDAGLNDLSQLTSLTRLGLDGTKVTSAGVAKLQGLLPKCEIIWDGK